MAKLYGRTWTKDELRARIGEAGQLAGIERVELDEGHARGTRAAILRTGGGLEAEILLDRAMDLGRVNFNGMALAYRGPFGDAHPSHYDARGMGWLRTFGGGLLTTCGLQNVGSPCEDEGQHHGMHGGISATPAAEVGVKAGWLGDDYALGITGKMREATDLGLFGPRLSLSRTIFSELGANWMRISDVVENEGFTESALMLLYHVNVGFPVVDEGARLLTAARSVEPRDEVAQAGLGREDRFEQPVAGYREQVFFHNLLSDSAGRATAAIVSPERPSGRVALALEYSTGTLGRFTEWKMMGAGAYVVGLEPANCLVMGRADERKRGTLQTLKPGERKVFELKISVLTGADEIGALEDTLAGLKGKGGTRAKKRKR